MKSFSFVHMADLHLGYMQYNLTERREDFSRAFGEAVEKTLELKPDFMIVAGDFFHEPRPGNPTLATVMRYLRRLRDRGIEVLTVDGSHDSAPNIVTGTILIPLDRAGLLNFLPMRDESCWRSEYCYVYGLPNFRRRGHVEDHLPEILASKPPRPDPKLFNIMVFHQAIDDPKLKPPMMEAEIRPDQLPDGFNYYAGGHIHKPHHSRFRSGILVYSGCTETTNYEEADIEKGFYYVEVSSDGESNIQRIGLTSPRPFVIIKPDCTGKMPDEITKVSSKLVEESDVKDVVIAVVLEGVLPTDKSRVDVNISQIRSAARRALCVHVVNRLEEVGISEELRRIIFREGKDMRTKAYEYFLSVFAERYSRDNAERLAKMALEIISPLVGGERESVKRILEEVVPQDEDSKGIPRKH